MILVDPAGINEPEPHIVIDFVFPPKFSTRGEMKTYGAAGGERSLTRDGGFALVEPLALWTPVDLKEILEKDEPRWSFG